MSTSQLLKRGWPGMTWAAALPGHWWYQIASCFMLPVGPRCFKMLYLVFPCFPFFGHLHNIGTSHHIFFPQLWLFRHQASAFPSLRNDPLWFVRASATAAAATATMVGTTTWEKDLKGVHLWNIHRHLQILQWSWGDQQVIHLVRIARKSSMSALRWTTRCCTSSAPLSATFAPGQRVSCKYQGSIFKLLKVLRIPRVS